MPGHGHGPGRDAAYHITRRENITFTNSHTIISQGFVVLLWESNSPSHSPCSLRCRMTQAMQLMNRLQRYYSIHFDSALGYRIWHWLKTCARSKNEITDTQPRAALLLSTGEVMGCNLGTPTKIFAVFIRPLRKPLAKSVLTVSSTESTFVQFRALEKGIRRKWRRK
jgi:hypothetical protein